MIPPMKQNQTPTVYLGIDRILPPLPTRNQSASSEKKKISRERLAEIIDEALALIEEDIEKR